MTLLDDDKTANWCYKVTKQIRKGRASQSRNPTRQLLNTNHSMGKISVKRTLSYTSKMTF